jgi:biopolymer transport protein ExbB
MMLALLQEADAVSRQTVWQWLVAGGPVMVPLGLCSVVAVGLILERYLRLRRDAVLPPPVEEAIEVAQRGDRPRALQMAAAIDAPAARILAAGLRRDTLPLLDLERAMEDQAAKESDVMRGRVRALSLIAAVAPLLGLLGTVLGLEDAFDRVVRVGMGKPEQLAAGINEALITTIAGLWLAIPLMLVASFLNARVRLLMRLVDQRLMPVVDAIVAERRRTDAA